MAALSFRPRERTTLVARSETIVKQVVSAALAELESRARRVGRLNSRTPPQVSLTPAPQPQNNSYLIQLAQLYEAGLLSPEALQAATVNIYS